MRLTHIFKTHFVEFYACDEVNYINSSSLVSISIQIHQQDLLFANHQADILNVYFVDDIAFGAWWTLVVILIYLETTNQYYDAVVMHNSLYYFTMSEQL